MREAQTLQQGHHRDRRGRLSHVARTGEAVSAVQALSSRIRPLCEPLSPKSCPLPTSGGGIGIFGSVPVFDATDFLYLIRESGITDKMLRHRESVGLSRRSGSQMLSVRSSFHVPHRPGLSGTSPITRPSFFRIGPLSPSSIAWSP